LVSSFAIRHSLLEGIETMRHRVAGRKFGRDSGQRKALFRNLVTELFRHERIRTTEAKAKAIKPQAERLITLAKRGDLHARRLAARDVQDPAVLQKLFSEIAERYEDRAGGYTRIYKLGPRLGDAAPVVLISLVE
jgi:large subunit ribosomal protein L17